MSSNRYVSGAGTLDMTVNLFQLRFQENCSFLPCTRRRGSARMGGSRASALNEVYQNDHDYEPGQNRRSHENITCLCYCRDRRGDECEGGESNPRSRGICRHNCEWRERCSAREL